MELKKKSFILHVDSLGVLSDLSDDQAGKLFKAMLAFHKGEELDLDPLTKMAFSFFKNQFIRDNEKYIKTCEARAQAGSKGGKQKQQNLASASKCYQKKAKVAENDSDNEKDSDSKKNKEERIIDAFDKFWSSYKKKMGKGQALKSFKAAIKRECIKDIESFSEMLINDCKERIAANQFGFDNLNASTYLNNNRWEDEKVQSSSQKGSNGSSSIAAEFGLYGWKG